MTTIDDHTIQERRARIVEKVRALLAKAASTEFEAESAAFETAALRLMAQWEIEERELRDAGPITGHSIDLTSFGNAGKGAAALACWLLDMQGGYGVLWSVGDGRSGRVEAYATPTQLERANLMLDHLLLQLRADIVRDRPRSRKSYSVGWASRVHQRLKATQQVIYSESAALVPTSDEAREAYEAHHGRARRTNDRVSHGDYTAGTAAGETADLNQPGINGQ